MAAVVCLFVCFKVWTIDLHKWKPMAIYKHCAVFCVYKLCFLPLINYMKIISACPTIPSVEQCQVYFEPPCT